MKANLATSLIAYARGGVRKQLLVLCLLTLCVGNMWAGASWIGKSYIVVNGTWYNADGTGQSNNFDGYNLGHLTSLTLGGEVQTYGQSDGYNNSATMGYQISGQSESSSMTLYWYQYNENNNWFHSASGKSSDFAANKINISGLTPGEYTLSVWFYQADGGVYDSNSNNNYVATFYIDPTITFDQQSGTGGTSSITGPWGAAMPSITLPSHAEKKFEGYYTGKNGTGTQYYAYNGNSVHTCDFTSNPTTLYANWKTPTEYTFYYAAPSDIVADNTVKCYVNYGYDQVAGDVDMTATNKTYNNKRIYSVTVTANYESFDAIYFKPKGLPGHGSEEQAANTSYVAASEINGKIYEHGVGWQTYAEDAPYTVYYVNTNNWDTPKAYAWSSDYDKSVANYSSSAAMTKTDYTYNGHDIYTITYTRGFTNVIFNDNASESAKTGDLECYPNRDKLYNGSTWQAYGRDVTVYTIPEYLFKDYSTKFSEETHYPSVCVQYGNSEWKTINMVKTDYTYDNYPIWKATFLLDYNIFKEFQIKYFDKANSQQVGLYQYNEGGNTEYPSSDLDDKLYHGWNGESHDFFRYTYDVKLDQQDGSGGTESIKATDGEVLPAATMPGRDGYIFGGYYTVVGGNGDMYYDNNGNSSAQWNSRTITTLYAKWTANTYYVKFNANGGTGTMNTQEFTYDVEQALTKNTFTKTGYTFAGWNTNSSGSGTPYTNQQSVINLKNNKNGELTLYAQWTANQYTITYKDQGNVNFSGTHANGAPTQHTYGTATTLKTPSKTGFSFDGWFTSSNCSGNAVTSLGATSYTDNITLYAKWTEHEYKIALVVDPEGAGTIDKGDTIAAYYTTDSDEITATASTGYSFSQWDFSKQGESDYDVWCADGYTSTNATISIRAKRDGTLTAKFIANNYNVNLENLDADEGYKGTENVSVTYNSSDSLKKNITIPQKAHYDFGGYYTGCDDLNKDVTGVPLINEYGEWIASVEGYTDGDKNWLYADTLTLYAKWTEHPYKIALVVAPEGAGTIDKGDTITAYYVTPTDLITATPANPAWKFKEWKYSENVGPANGTGNDNTVQINAAKAGTLTANFEERYSIKGTMNGENWGTTHTLSNIGTNAGSKDTCYVTMTLPANTTYEFAIYDEQTKGWLKNSTTEVFKMTYGNSSAWPFDTDKTVNCGITTAGKGTYKFIFNITDKTVTVVYPTSYQVNYGASPSVGGNITVVDDDSQAVPNGGYVRSGGSVTYTAAAASGYTFVGWCNDDSYGEPFTTYNPWPNNSVTATSNAYAKFKSTNFVIYRSGDMSSDPRAAYDDVESYAGGTISETIEFRMRVNRLDQWYTLCLPFTVTAVKVWDEEDGQYYDIVPYYRTGDKYYTGHYIIRTPVRTTDFAIENFDSRDRWVDPSSAVGYLPSANTPYIIQWHDSWFQNKYISFFGPTGASIPTSMNQGANTSSDETVNIYGNNSMTTGTVRDAYLLDPYYGTDGAWMREEIGTDRSVLPFECFILANEKTTAKYRVLRRDIADDTPTGLDTLSKTEDTVSKVLINNRIYIIRGGKMYTIQGTFVKEVE